MRDRRQYLKVVVEGRNRVIIEQSVENHPRSLGTQGCCLLKIFDMEVIISGEGFTQRSEMT